MDKHTLLQKYFALNRMLNVAHWWRFLFLALLLCTMTSCNNDVVYDEIATVPEQGWKSVMPALFNVEIEDTLTYQEIFLTISHSTAYHYRNIYFFITVKFPDGRMARDTVNYNLANDYGEWYGNGLGSIKTLQMPYRQHVIFPYKGEYKFYFEQAMRDDTLENITALGLMIRKETR